MKEWLENIDGLFKRGLTDVNFQTDQWTSMTVGSEITRKLTARGLSVGNILSKNEASLLIEQAIRQKIVVDEYCDMNEVSKIAGTYYTLADGRILRKFYGPSGAITYTFVGKIPKDKVGGTLTEDSGGIDSIQLGLDALGFIPGVGEIADGVNGTIYTVRGDKTNAALSFSAMIPIVGSAGTAGKWINKSVDTVDDVSDAVGKTKKSVNDGVTIKGMGEAGQKVSVANSKVIEELEGPVIDGKRVGSGKRVDEVKPVWGRDEKGKPFIEKEFPHLSKEHGFSDVIDNY